MPSSVVFSSSAPQQAEFSTPSRSRAHTYALEHDAWQAVMTLGAVTAVILSLLPVVRFGTLFGPWQAFVLSAIFSSVLCGLLVGAVVSLLSGLCALSARGRELTPWVAAVSGALALFGYVAVRAPLELSLIGDSPHLRGMLRTSGGVWSHGLWGLAFMMAACAAVISFRMLRTTFRGRLCARPLLVRGALSALLLVALTELLARPSVADHSPLHGTADLAALSALGR